MADSKMDESWFACTLHVLVRECGDEESRHELEGEEEGRGGGNRSEFNADEHHITTACEPEPRSLSVSDSNLETLFNSTRRTPALRQTAPCRYTRKAFWASR